MAFFSSFLTQRKPRQFSYRPRFYDEEREKREQRTRAAEHLSCEPSIRGTFRQRRIEAGRIQRQSNNRIFIIAGILAAVFYLVFLK